MEGQVAMRVIQLISAGLAIVLCGLCGDGCKKAEEPARVDPHSADGAMQRLQEQGRLFQDAYARKDFRYLHDWGYYFNGVLQAFFLKLDDAQKQRLRGTVDELIRVSSQLDSATGRGHEGATEAVVQRIQTLLQELEKQYQESKPRR